MAAANCYFGAVFHYGVTAIAAHVALNFLQVNKVRTMYAHKLRCG